MEKVGAGRIRTKTKHNMNIMNKLAYVMRLQGGSGCGCGTWRFALNVALIICHEIFMNVRRDTHTLACDDGRESPRAQNTENIYKGGEKKETGKGVSGSLRDTQKRSPTSLQL